MDVVHLGEVDSTNDHAKRLLGSGRTGLFWVRADRQTAGRGRLRREWTSREGNLFCTGAIPTERPVRERHRYSFAAALAVRDLLQAGGVTGVEMKWPNDVLVDDRKVAGILLESERDHIVVGIGLNIAHHPEDTRTPATHLAELGWRPGVEEAFRGLAYAVLHRFGQPWERVHREWLIHACCIGEEFRVKRGGDSLLGTYEGLGEDGELLLRTRSGTVPVTSGDIQRLEG